MVKEGRGKKREEWPIKAMGRMNEE